MRAVPWFDAGKMVVRKKPIVQRQMLAVPQWVRAVIPRVCMRRRGVTSCPGLRAAAGSNDQTLGRARVVLRRGAFSEFGGPHTVRVKG